MPLRGLSWAIARRSTVEMYTLMHALVHRRWQRHRGDEQISGRRGGPADAGHHFSRRYIAHQRDRLVPARGDPEVRGRDPDPHPRAPRLSDRGLLWRLYHVLDLQL